MSVALCLITHDGIGEALLNTAVSMLGSRPLPASIISVGADANPEQVLAHAKEQLRAIDEGDGVIVLTDMFGSTPANIASALADEASPASKSGRVVVISGLNLPMLIRLMNYPSLTVTQLADKAVSGGQEGIFKCMPDEEFS
jgi:PTS system mannose-specific IIA component